jgi:hypothetical protein
MQQKIYKPFRAIFLCTEGHSGSHAFGDSIRPSYRKAAADESGTKRFANELRCRGKLRNNARMKLEANSIQSLEDVAS